VSTKILSSDYVKLQSISLQLDLNIEEFRKYKNVKQSRYRPGRPRGFQEVKVPRFRDNGTRWW